MEHDEKALPIDVRVLGALASRVGAYAKALHYKEMEYHNTENPGALRTHRMRSATCGQMPTLCMSMSIMPCINRTRCRLLH